MFGRKHNNMKGHSTRNRRFAVESLEDRRLMAANTMGGEPFVGPEQYAAESPKTAMVSSAEPGGNSGGQTAPTTGATIPSAPPAFDSSLTARWVQYGTSNLQQFVVDGSDYDDVVKVLDYRVNGSDAYFTVQLEKWSNGVQLSSSMSRYHKSPGAEHHPVVYVQGKGGDDKIENNTGASLNASGGVGHDWIYGGTTTDYIFGDDGYDLLYGRGGADYLYGGDRTDNLYGGEGNDILYGGTDGDYLYGNAGNDYLFGEAGDDGLYGDDATNNPAVAGWDWLYGGIGNDTLRGDAGDDTIYGNDGDDLIWGGWGNDWMEGGNHNDKIYGEDGSDVLYGNEGKDEVYGGNGDDYLNAGYRTGPSIDEPEILWGGQGADCFIRHKSTFGFDDDDRFIDYNSGAGDWTENVWHW